MSYLIAITFDNAEEAPAVRETLRKSQSGGYLSLNDSAVIVKDADGKVHIKDEVDRGVKVGAIGGGFLGLLLGGLFFPIAGLVIGVLGGAVVGSLLDKGIDKEFIKDIKEAMQPGSSAIFFIYRDEKPDAAIAALRPYKGEIYHTNLSPEAEEALRRELKDRIQ